jgi:uncharacterized membrane protein
MNSLDQLMQQIRGGLANAPKSLADDVLAYYAEYFDDARKAGLSDDEILAKVGPAERIVHSALDEIAIDTATDHPNPVSLLRTSRRMFGRGVARAAQGTGLALASLWPLLAAIVLYISAAAAALAAPAAAALLIWNMVAHPALSPASLLAQAGLLVSLVCVLLFLAWGLWIWANALGRLTLWLFRKIASHSDVSSAAPRPAGRRQGANPAVRRRGRRIAAVLLAVLLLAGAGFAAFGGLYQEYWALWNSVKPADVTNETATLVDPVTKMTISLLNTRVEIVPGDGPAVEITYDKMPYFELGREQIGGYLVLTESANGRLPLADLLAIHEGSGVLRIALPTADVDLEINTLGGHVDILAPCRSITVNTYNGNITLQSPDGTYSGKLESTNGKISIIQ